MSKDLHKMDETFNSAYKQLSEDPSPDVWEKISAGLDKKDASSYKRKLKTWKRVAILSLFLLSSFVLYDTFLKTNPAHSNKNLPVAVNGTTKAETTNREDKNINQLQSPSLGPATNVSHAAVTDNNTATQHNILPGDLNVN